MADASPFVYIIVLNWNGWRDTVRCLASVDQLVYQNRRVVVVDNASTDRSVEHIQTSYPDAQIIQTGQNLGYGAGNNVGINYALEYGAEYIWILNNDTEVSCRSLSTLVEVMEQNPNIGILAPRVFDPVRAAFEPERAFPRGVSCAGPAKPTLAPCGNMSAVQLVDYVSGSCMLIRSRVLVELGAFDARYFHFYEDADLCWRAWCREWAVARTPRCEIHHRIGSSTSDAPAFVAYYSLRNLLLFSAVAAGTSMRRIVLRRCNLWLGSLLGLRGFRNPRVKLAAVHAIADAVSGRTGRSARH
jgi:GT2 family glycosyltransferase